MDRTMDITFPGAVRSVAVCGGTFDPPTRAHVELPIAVVDAIRADWLLVIPAAISPFKPGGAHATDLQRLEMLELAFADRPCVTVTQLELRRGGTSYTVETLRALREVFPKITFRLVIGADQAESFHRWREARAIIECAEPAVMLRGDDECADRLIETMSPNWSAEELDAWRGRIVKIPTLDLSSTEARSILSSPAPDEMRLVELLDSSVLEYIRQAGLYGAGAIQ